MDNKQPDLSVRGLAAWLETHDPETKYNYNDNHDCLIARFVKSQGFDDVSCGGTTIFAGGTDHHLNQDLRDAAFGLGGKATYGLALARCQKVLG